MKKTLLKTIAASTAVMMLAIPVVSAAGNAPSKEETFSNGSSTAVDRFKKAEKISGSSTAYQAQKLFLQDMKAYGLEKTSPKYFTGLNAGNEWMGWGRWVVTTLAIGSVLLAVGLQILPR